MVTPDLQNTKEITCKATNYRDINIPQTLMHPLPYHTMKKKNNVCLENSKRKEQPKEKSASVSINVVQK